MTELLLVRHSQPHEGAADPGLTDDGRAMAAALARWLSHDPIGLVLASPLRRARETAAPLAAALGQDVVLDDGLLEWEAIPPRPQYIRLELAGLDHPGMLALHEGRYNDFRPAGFDEEKFLTRAHAALLAIFERSPGERIVAVAHGGIINAMLSAVLQPAGGFFWVLPAYTAVSVIERVQTGRLVVRTVNETGHLLGERTPGRRRPTVLDG